MHSFVLLLLVSCMAALALAREAPVHATKDLLWPKPAVLTTGPVGEQRVVLDPLTFYYSLDGGSGASDVLRAAVNRYHDILFKDEADQLPQPVSSADPVLSAVSVRVTNLSAPLSLFSRTPASDFGADESYVIEVTTRGAVINAPTVWGALRGMELFSQMVQLRRGEYSIEDLPITVKASPRFAHRGLLLDSARHFLPLDTIRRTIDALAWNHMNTLHWHLVDAESFPFNSTRSPKLVDGAYSPSAVYSKSDVAGIIEYARFRGVRVVMEVDMPGHAHSWRYGYPNVVAKCPRYEGNINNVPLNPAVDQTWTVIDGLLRDLLGDLNKDKYFHIGADEVVYGCWKQDDVLMDWAEKQGFATMVEVMKYFQERLWDIVHRYGASLIAWEEVLTDYGLTDLPKDLVIHVWKDGATLLKSANLEQPAIMSFGWYLDHPQNWKDFYLNEPFSGEGWTEKNRAFVIGGEAAAWGEMVSEHNLDATLWPRSSSVAERLWSPESVKNVDDAAVRINLHVCRLNRRGVGAAPIRPNHCY